MRTSLTNPISRRTRRSVIDLIDRRISAALEAKPPRLEADADIADLRRQLADTQRRQRALEVLLNDGGRGMARMPSPANINDAESTRSPP